MIGPRVRVKFLGTSWNNGQPSIRVEFEPSDEPAGREKFWGEESEPRTQIMLSGVNPMAIETMEVGKEYDLVFSPVDEVPAQMRCTCGEVLSFKPHQSRGMCRGCDGVWVLYDGKWEPLNA
jgi:hypothetical protein